MGRIRRDLFGDGFTYRDDDGAEVHYRKRFLGSGYVGDDGSSIDPHLFDDGFTLRDERGHDVESFHTSLFSGGLKGSKGTRVSKGLFGETRVDKRKKW